MTSQDTILELRHTARDAFLAGIKAADPAVALANSLANTTIPRPQTDGRYIVIAVGKAACKMADHMIQALPIDADIAAIAVTNFENVVPVARCNVFGASHPVPCEKGFAAARRVITLLNAARASDTVIFLISGGASALLPAPVDGVSLGDKAAVNSALLANGFDIYQTNLVRQSLSLLKGGGALRLAAPAQVCSFILSDVLGDDLRVVGSGPSVGALGTAQDARALLVEQGIYDGLPNAVRHHLETTAPKPTAMPAPAHLIAGNRNSVSAMAAVANATLIDAALVGDVQDAAQVVVEAAKAHAGPRPIALAFGGETTVTIKGAGKGGRNQELALRVALAARAAGLRAPWCFLSGGTDGRDGPTDAAGGLVDHTTLDRIGEDAQTYLQNNDSYHALKAAGDLLITGATGTNVADLQLFLLG